MPNKNPKPNQAKIRTIDKITPEMNQFMDIIRLKESNDKSGIRNRKGSAYGYYQFIGSTLNNFNTKYGTNYTLNTREEQHEMMRLMMLENQDFFKKNNIPETLDNYYKKHVIGDNVKFLKFVKAEQQGGSLASYLTQKEINDNPGLFKDKSGRVLSVTEANKKISTFINDGKKLSAKEPSDRKKQLQLEKSGIYEGRSTPLDKRPGNYVNDGKAQWDPNSVFYNGTKLGEQSNDFVVGLNNGKKKVILQGGTKETEVDQAFTPKGYNYENAQLYDDSTWSNSPSSQADSDAWKFADPSIQNFSSGNPNVDLSYDQIRNPRPQVNQDRQLNRADLLNSTARFSNEKNPHMEAGNIADLMMTNELGNNVVLNDPSNMNVSPTVLMNRTMGATNPDMPQANAQRDFKQGGNLNQDEMKVNKKLNKASEEGSGDLISFNEGGTHEENPLGGIPQNTNPDGSVNKVEEGETKHEDYVFSNSLSIDKELANDLRLPKEIEGMTFSEASKFLNEALKENPRDPIIKRTVEKQLDNLKVGNDKARQDNLVNEQEVRQAEFESNNVDLLNEYERSQNQQGVIETVDNPIPTFTEDDLNSFANGGDTTYNTTNNITNDYVDEEGNAYNKALTGIGSGLNLASTLAFADDPYQEEKINAGQTALKGASAGATLGATVGSIIPGLGTVIGGAAGAVIGGVGGLIVGNSKAKKQEKVFKQREEQRQNRALAPFKDPRSESGFIEDRDVFADGGDLRGKRGTGITYTNFDENDLEDLFNLNLNPNQMINSNVNEDNPFDEEIGYDALNVPATSSESNTKPRQFRPRGENLLQYASLFGSYQDMKNANRKEPVVETYRASGNRMTPREVDINAIMNELRISGSTADAILQNNASGNSAVARANILANRSNVNRATGEALIKAEEFNTAQEQQALQYNNQLAQYGDKTFNEQTIANTQHMSALEAERFARRRDFLTNLSNFGRERSNRNAAYNLSGGFDRYGNYNQDAVNMFEEAIRRFSKNNN